MYLLYIYIHTIIYILNSHFFMGTLSIFWTCQLVLVPSGMVVEEIQSPPVIKHVLWVITIPTLDMI